MSVLQEIIESQIDIKNMLDSSFKKQRLSHAYIFDGAKGTPRFEMALYFLALFYSPDPFSGNDVEEIFSQKHYNLYVINPIKDIIGVDQIEALQEEFFKTSLVPGARLYIINEAEKMNVYAQNKLLKFIEEPPAKDIYAMFITSSYSSLLPTIISRCNIINFKSPSKDDLYNKFIESNMEVKYASLIKELTFSFKSGLELYKSDSFKKIVDNIINFLKLKEVKEYIKYFINLESFILEYDNFKQFLEILVIILLDSINDKSSLKGFEEEIKEFKTSRDFDILSYDLELTLRILRMLDARVNPKNLYALFLSHIK